MKDNKKDANKGEASTSSDDEVNPQMQEAIAAYFEQQNGGPVADLSTLLNTEAQVEWQRTVTLLEVPKRVAQSAISTAAMESAWQKFRVQAFDVPPLAQVSLGGYVAQAMAQSEQTTLNESGLARPTLEALKADPTPISELKDYELNDYAALARRYGVKDTAFPRMLKWLKSLGKNFAFPSLNANPGRGMVFAREDEPRQPGMSEQELAENMKAEAKDEGDDNKGE